MSSLPGVRYFIQPKTGILYCDIMDIAGYFPTHNRDIDLLILSRLPHEDLVLYRKVCRYFFSICSSQEFWRIKLSMTLNCHITPLNRDYRLIYRALRRKSKCLNEGLRESSRLGYDDIISALLDLGADVRWCNNTPLIMAATNGHTSAVRLLLDRGARINARNGEALRNAVQRRYSTTEKLLIERKADVLCRDGAAIGYALREDLTEVIDAMLQNGLNPNIVEAKREVKRTTH